MPYVRALCVVFLLEFGLSLFFSRSGFSVITTDEECSKPLAKLASNPSKNTATPLRPQGNEVQEKYFKVIDQVANNLQGKEEFNSPMNWRRITAGMGLPGLDLPKDVGGSEISAREMVNIFDYAGRYSLNLRDIAGGGHSRTLIDSTNPEQREIMRQVAAGKAYMAIAITEPDHGSDIAGMKSISKKVEGGYRLTGEKKYNARLENGTHVVIFTQADSSTPKQVKLNAFVLPLDYPGLEFEKLEAAGLKGNSFGGVSFDNLFVPEKYRIGNEGQGREIFSKHFTYWRIMQTAAAIGTANRALEMTADRLITRKVYDKPLAAMTHLTQPLGKLTYELKMVMKDLERAAQLYDEGKIDEADEIATAAKSWGVEKAHEAAQFAVKTHGAKGYSNELDLFERMTDLSGMTIADGASDVLMSSYVRYIYGKPFWDIPFGKKKKR
ncbi:MAG: acyl-CoA dehydrogenase [Deltaproteobacteria bacterium]|nr:acyl-CoA dehydrogenase [Deltaproteobacteria bacterium]